MNRSRINALMHKIVNDLEIDLTGQTVLTECASNLFAVTPLIAALAGADKVIAYAKDTKYGLTKDTMAFLDTWAEELGVSDRVFATSQAPHTFAKDVNIVTNLNLLRPINEDVINALPVDSCIPLMWEPWEFREEDLDLNHCNKKGIPVLGTNETHPRLEIFRYVGLTALKLLFEMDIEVFQSKIAIIGGDPFAKEADDVLSALEAETLVLDPQEYPDLSTPAVKDKLKDCDAIVVLEHHSKEMVIGGDNGIPVTWISENSIALVHICGGIDDVALKNANITKHPNIDVAPGYMTATTAYMGPRAVVDLHAAGLKVGELVVKGLRSGLTPDEAKAKAVASGIALDF